MTQKGSTTSTLLRTLASTLREAGYAVQTRVDAGKGPAGGRVVAEIVASLEGEPGVILSAHAQRNRGSTETKIPWEVITWAFVLDSAPDRFARAVIVLSGSGWTLKDYFLEGGLNRYMRGIERVRLVSLDTFLEAAQSHGL